MDGDDERFVLEPVSRRRRGMVPVALIVVALVSLVGIGLATRFGEVLRDSSGPTESPDLTVAWTSATAEPSEAPTYVAPPPDVPPCTAPTLSAAFQWADADAWPIGTLIVGNTGPEPCFLTGVPTIAVLVEGRAVETAVGPGGLGATVVLARAERAVTYLTFSELCRTFATPVRLSMSLGIPNLGVNVPLPPGFATRCGVPAQTPVDVSPVGSGPPDSSSSAASTDPAPAGASASPSSGSAATPLARLTPFEPWPAKPHPKAPAVQVSIQPGWGVKQGDRLEYTVELVNTSGKAISLSPCPSYRQYLVGRELVPPASYRLNCNVMAGPIAPGQRVKLAMVLPVSPMTPPGLAVVAWEALSGFSGVGTAQLQILPR